MTLAHSTAKATSTLVRGAVCAPLSKQSLLAQWTLGSFVLITGFLALSMVPVLVFADEAPSTPVEAVPESPKVLPEGDGAPAPDGTVVIPCEVTPKGTACILGGYFVRGSNSMDHIKCRQMGRPSVKTPDTLPEARVWLQTYYLDLTEVTHGAYQACYKSRSCNKARPKYQDYNHPKQPMTGLSWFDAVKYCKAQGQHLPTEAEWEKGARGPAGDLYPWGNEPSANCELAVVMNEAGERSCGEKKRRGSKPEKGRVLEVGSKPAGRYGLYDMVGNAEEWVADWYSWSYERCGEDCTGMNPLGPCQGAEKCKRHRYKVVRGGSWYYPPEHATGFHRRPHFPANKPYHHFGFRCAASVDEARDIDAKKDDPKKDDPKKGDLRKK